MQVDLKIVQLLCSRLCHDLIGPAGAVHNGMELFEEMGVDDGADALKMVTGSINQLSARLAFFRMAFGLGGLNAGPSALTEARELSNAFLETGRISLDWPDHGNGDAAMRPSGAVIKLLLNMILVAIDALPRGGTLTVSLAAMEDPSGQPATGLAVKAYGDGARLKDDLMETLSAITNDDETAGLNAHNVHGYFCQCLARALSADMQISSAANEVRFAILVQEAND